MKKNKIKIALIILLVMLVVIVIGVKTYNKPHVDVVKTEAKYKLDAQQLINSFITDEDKASKKYVNTIIQVSGEALEISHGTISIKYKNSASTILCNFLPKEDEKLKTIKKGDKIKVKGICTGYLLDVVLVECVLIKESN